MQAWWRTPDGAWLALLAGLVLVYGEFLRPGTVLPGVAGGVLTLLAVAALWDLGPGGGAVTLLLLATAGLILLARLQSPLWIGLVPALVLVWAARALVAPRISWWVAALTAPHALLTLWLLRIAVRARRNKTAMRTGR